MQAAWFTERSPFHWRLFSNLAVSQAGKYFEDFAPCGKGTSALSLVVIHGSHELNFAAAVVSFAGRRINLSATILSAAIGDLSSFFSTDSFG